MGGDYISEATGYHRPQIAPARAISPRCGHDQGGARRTGAGVSLRTSARRNAWPWVDRGDWDRKQHPLRQSSPPSPHAGERVPAEEQGSATLYWPTRCESSAGLEINVQNPPPVDVLARWEGREIAGIAGLVVGCAANTSGGGGRLHLPAGAILADGMSPHVREYLFCRPRIGEIDTRAIWK